VFTQCLQQGIAEVLGLADPKANGRRGSAHGARVAAR
jgi:hypothetical protein